MQIDPCSSILFTTRAATIQYDVKQHSKSTMNASHVYNTALPVPGLSKEAEQKKRFLIFIKILFKSLSQSACTDVREKAKNIVSDCTRRNRLGDPQCTPLMDAIDRRLRCHVGEAHWRRAHVFMQHYIRRESRPRPRPQVLIEQV